MVLLSAKMSHQFWICNVVEPQLLLLNSSSVPLLKALPTLKSIDGNERNTAASEPKRSDFEHMCLGHEGEHQKLKEAYIDALRCDSGLGSVTCRLHWWPWIQQNASKGHSFWKFECQVMFYAGPFPFRQASSKEAQSSIHRQYFNRSHQLAEDHRLAHEYGETSHRKSASMTFEFSTLASSQAEENTKSQVVDMKAKFEAALSSMQGGEKLGNVDLVSAPESAMAEVKQQIAAEAGQGKPCNLGSAEPTDSSLPTQAGLMSSQQMCSNDNITASLKTSVSASVVGKTMKAEEQTSAPGWDTGKSRGHSCHGLINIESPFII